jgi:hypothetical protein
MAAKFDDIEKQGPRFVIYGKMRIPMRWQKGKTKKRKE